MNHFIRPKFKTKLDIYIFFSPFIVLYYFVYFNIINIMGKLYFILNFVGCIF